MAIIITGPTASGKTPRAVALARLAGGEIISADSRQVFRGMDIGSGKDLADYGSVPYHMIDVALPGEEYSLFRWLEGAHAAEADIEARGKLPIVCGGTGMYVEAFARGTKLPEVPPDPELRARLASLPLSELCDILAGMKALHATTDTSTAARAIRAIEIQTYYINHPELAPDSLPGSPVAGTPPGGQPLIIGVDIDRDTRRRLIELRLDSRLDSGLIDEVRGLIDSGVDVERLLAYGLEYRFITRHILGEISFDEMRTLLLNAIRQFAKRQMTWFRGMERRGLKLHWISAALTPDEFAAEAMELIKAHPHP